ncbi:MAG: aminopeptidase P family protein [Pirellulaceae bacterium]
MKHVTIPAALFIENRQRLIERLPPRSLVVLQSNDIMPTNADGTMGFHQNADLFYLSGINQEETALLLAPNAFDEKLRQVLFVRESNEHLTIWEGHKLTKQQAREMSGIATVKWSSEFRGVFHALMSECDHVYLNTNEHTRAVVEVETREARFVRDCQARYPLHDYRRLARLMHELRAVKSSHEVDLIRHACQITRGGFLRVLEFVKPGVNEAEIEAEFAHEFTRQRATFAYPPIIASGENNCVLHYNQNDQACKKGQLILLDVAAGYGQYMSDLTRTIPVGGRFSRRQKQVYQAVLRVFRQVVAAMRPGTTTRDLRKLTEQLIEAECLELGLLKATEVRKQDPDQPAVRRYFMHGVSHPLGLDVHDVGPMWEPIRPGWVLTCEPGIYVREEGFGIRLENDILVTDGEPVDLMADIPIEADEIEQCMGDAK